MKISLDEIKNKINIAIKHNQCQLSDIEIERIYKTLSDGIEFPSDTNKLTIKCENLLDTKIIENLFFIILNLKNIEVVVHHIDHGWKSHKFDKNGNIIEEKSSSGYDKIYKYDDDNRLVYYRDRNYSYSLKYDQNGNKISHIDNQGMCRKWKYDNNNNLLSHSDGYLDGHSDGYSEKYIYDNDDNLTRYENSNGFWKIYEYDKNNNITYTEDSDGNWLRYTYRKNEKFGILKSLENSDGFIKYFNEFGAEIEEKEIQEIEEMKLDISFE